MVVSDVFQQGNFDPYGVVMKKAEQHMTEAVASFVDPSFFAGGSDGRPVLAGKDVVKGLFHLAQTTRDGVERIYPMNNFKLSEGDYLPTGSVTVFKRKAALTPLAFGTENRIAEQVMAFKVLDGTDVTELVRDPEAMRRANALLESFRHDVYDGRDDVGAVEAIGFGARGIDLNGAVGYVEYDAGLHQEALQIGGLLGSIANKALDAASEKISAAASDPEVLRKAIGPIGTVLQKVINLNDPLNKQIYDDIMSILRGMVAMADIISSAGTAAANPATVAAAAKAGLVQYRLAYDLVKKAFGSVDKLVGSKSPLAKVAAAVLAANNKLIAKVVAKIAGSGAKLDRETAAQLEELKANTRKMEPVARQAEQDRAEISARVVPDIHNAYKNAGKHLDHHYRNDPLDPDLLLIGGVLDDIVSAASKTAANVVTKAFADPKHLEKVSGAVKSVIGKIFSGKNAAVGEDLKTFVDGFVNVLKMIADKRVTHDPELLGRLAKSTANLGELLVRSANKLFGSAKRVAESKTVQATVLKAIMVPFSKVQNTVVKLGKQSEQQGVALPRAVSEELKRVDRIEDVVDDVLPAAQQAADATLDIRAGIYDAAQASGIPPVFEDPFAADQRFAEDAALRQKLVRSLLERPDARPWRCSLSASANNSISLGHDGSDVYIFVRASAELSSREFLALVAYYSRFYDGKMTIKDFVELYPWYAMHVDNSERNAKHLAYQAAKLLRVRIESEVDTRFHVENAYTDVRPRMGVPTISQGVNVLELLPHLRFKTAESGNKRTYDDYVREGILSVRSNVDARDYFRSDATRGLTPVFFNMCTPNPLYHPFSHGSGLAIGRNVSRVRDLDRSGDQLHAQFLASNPHLDVVKVRSKCPTGMIKESIAVETPLEHRYIVMNSPDGAEDDGTFIVRRLVVDDAAASSVQLVHPGAKADNPGFLAMPCFGVRRAEGLMSVNSSVAAAAATQASEKRRSSGGNRILDSVFAGHQQLKHASERQKLHIGREIDEKHRVSTVHLYPGVEEGAEHERIGRNVYASFRDNLLPSMMTALAQPQETVQISPVKMYFMKHSTAF
jgi:hypothetical protein